MLDRVRLQVQDRMPIHRPAVAPSRAPGTVLVIEESIPEYDRHAGGLYVWQLLQLLAERGTPVAFRAHDRVTRQPYDGQLHAMGVEVLRPDVDWRHWIRAHDASLDAVIVARPEMGRRYFRGIRAATGARLAYYTHDLHFVREMRRFEQTGDAAAARESHRLKRIETRLLRAADVAMTPSSAEVSVIRRIAPGTPTFAVPPFVVPVTTGPTAGLPLVERRAVLMVGSFRHLPNRDAAIHLVRDVMPVVWQSVPDATVVLVGGDPPEEVQRLRGPRVEVLGHVPDLTETYGRARMTVSPLRFGSGLKGKILASLEAGIPVVTTSIGNEGIDLVSGRDALIADDPGLLAHHVITLFQDRELLARLAAQGQEAATTRFSREAARHALMTALGH